MAPLLLLLACGLLPGALAQCDLQRTAPLYKRAAYEFAAQLTTRIAQEKDNHFVASTLSVWALLATAALGADGPTLDEFRHVLRLHRQRCFNDKYFELVRLKPTDVDVTIEQSSSIFAAEGLRIRSEFVRRARRAGVGEVVTLPFDDPDAVANTISEHVSRATHNTVNDLVPPSELDAGSVLVVDALYFKGMWRTPFPPQNTRPRPFYDELGAQVGEVEMMRVMGSFNVSTVDMVGATVLELPFGASGNYVMLVFLPRDGTTLSAVIDNLMRVSLTTIYTLFARNYPETVAVEIPRFAISSDLDNLKELLSDMGLRSAFDSYEAQFPFLSEEALFISNVVQKARVEVKEEGAEASAATAGFFASRSSPGTFTADRPFFYMIVDTATEVPLFTGAFSKPN